MIRTLLPFRVMVIFVYLALCWGFIANATERYEWITEGNLIEEREVFSEAFNDVYQDISLEKLKIGQPGSKHQSLKDFFKALMDEDEEALKSKTPDVYFIRVRDENDKVLGYASFDVEEKERQILEAYIRLLAVAPLAQGKGIGRELVNSILEKQPHLSRLYLVTRRVNEQAIGFYKHIGFQESSDRHEGFDPTLYIGLEKILK